MARKKRAWNSTNALWRYLHGQKKAKRAKRAGGTMARRKRGGFRKGHRRNGGGGLKHLLMKGFVGSSIPFGIIGAAIAGYAYTKFVSPNVPKVLPFQSALTESLAVGGVPAAVGSFIASGVQTSNAGGAP